MEETNRMYLKTFTVCATSSAISQIIVNDNGQSSIDGDNAYMYMVVGIVLHILEDQVQATDGMDNSRQTTLNQDNISDAVSGPSAASSTAYTDGTGQTKRIVGAHHKL
jgi:hypothetical protein